MPQTEITADNQIDILSWPAPWIYFPIYVALARVETEFDQLRFCFRTTAGQITDSKLREEFALRANRAEKVFALCEPDAAGSIGATNPIDKVEPQRLPVLWRQPHWVLWRGKLSSGGGPIRLWTYPSGTTSGDYIRSVSNVLPLFDKREIERLDLPADIAEERSFVLDLPPDVCVATFTPWHRCLESKLGEPRHALDHESLSGPSQCVTALLIPKNMATTTTIDDRSVSAKILKRLHGCLEELGNTHGDRRLVRQMLLRDDTLGLVERFLARSAKEFNTADWLNLDFLVPALAEFIRLGCYFPYQSLTSAIATEVRARVDNALQEFKAATIKRIDSDLRGFLGSAETWANLSFAQRNRAWGHWKGLPNGNSLTAYFSHAHPLEDMRFALTSAEVSIDESLGYIPLRSLVSGMPLQCNRDPDCRTQRSQLNCGVVTADSPVFHCFGCNISGLPHTVVSPAAAKLAKALKIEVAYRIELNGDRHFCCPLCFEDIEGVVDLFIEEARAPNRESRGCEVVLYSDTNNAAPPSANILFGIWHRGGVERNTGDGRATTGLKTISRFQENAGRDVKWAGFLWPKMETHRLFPATEEKDFPVRRALIDFEERNFDFGYAVVFGAPRFHFKSGEADNGNAHPAR